MGERHLVIDRLKLQYEGLFNTDELYTLIQTFFYTRHWDWHETMNQEIHSPSGMQIKLIFDPWKSVSDYYKILMNIKLNFIDVKNVEVEHEGRKINMNHGNIRFLIDGYVLSDRFDQWSDKPFTWFLSVLMEKYLFKSHYRKKEIWIKSDVDDLHNQIKNYLNMTKYSYRL